MLSPHTSIDAEVHLRAIRKALANRSAAVMVGAGFSRNAEGGENLATWRQLTQALAMDLEPDHKPGDFSPGAAAQLAEQYARVFSPAHLEKLIKRCVPDDQVSPGKLHAQLLELPWSEIFTTNYDTLLERAAERMFEVGYFTICAREDIPQSKVQGRRRIVKLHGSFPSHRPFILTEEEYRTYPDRFAPFVNMVRQSLLENVFCLIGFSGDDPNFLHWLGWVRDMLDKHALPVYLFLAQEPTLGERKLYEARGVVPVVLPTTSNAAPDDFKARYGELFSELAKPLENSPLDWGDSPNFPFIPNEGSQEANFLTFMQHVAKIFGYRDTYPDWIVAPKKVRSRFKRIAEWIERALHENWLSTYLGSCHPDLVLLVIDCYCWAQSVVLAPIIDDIAEIGREALLAAKQSATPQFGDEVAALIFAIRTSEGNSPERIRIRVAMALLTWARQSHHGTQYIEIRNALEAVRQENVRVSDHLIYEGVLNLLQRADRPSALVQTRRWRPATANAYAHVLRGALLAELGDDTAGIAALAHAIQLLRRQQRSRPNDPGLISQEAWACLVARHLQDAADFFKRINRSSIASDHDSMEDADGGEESIGMEDLNDRLGILVARGYSAEDELSDFNAKLNAEATPPAPSLRNLVGFNIGTSSSHQVFGVASELRDKVLASFAWLELIDRVGLPHRTNSASFYSDQMLQAAWWARFQDTPERSTGLFLRAHRKSALKPRDGYGRPHLSGWLDRHEIATLQETTATELAQALIDQLKADLQGSSRHPLSKDRGEFLIEAFGRLAVRSHKTEKILGWANDLIALHRNTSFLAQSELWEPASGAMARLMEALPDHMHPALLIEIFRIPVLPTPTRENGLIQHHIEYWVDVRKISEVCKSSCKGGDTTLWVDIAEALIAQLRTEDQPTCAAKIWARLSIMRWMELLTPEHRHEIGIILWQPVSEGGWPTVPGHYPEGTLYWPSPLRNPASTFLEKLLDRPLAPFSSGKMQYRFERTNRSYALGGAAGTVGQIHSAVSFAPPALSQIVRIFARISEWLDTEQVNLLEDISTSDIRDALADVCNYVDMIICCCLDRVEKGSPSKTTKSLREQALTLSLRLGRFPFPLIHTRVRLVKFNTSSRSELLDDAKAVASGLAAGTPSTFSNVFQASHALLSHDDSRLEDAGQLIFDALIACIFTQRAASISQVLNLFSHLPAHAWQRYASQRTLSLIDIALSELLGALSYKRVASPDSIPRESVPQVRFYTVKLAHTMVELLKLDSPAARSWLDEAQNDPLPEIRFGRYKLGTR